MILLPDGPATLAFLELLWEEAQRQEREDAEMGKRHNNVDPKRCEDCTHSGTVHHVEADGKRYCVVCRRTGSKSKCA